MTLFIANTAGILPYIIGVVDFRSLNFRFWSTLYGVIMMNDAERKKSTGMIKDRKIQVAYYHKYHTDILYILILFLFYF
jgi:hypothetical protein